jgi:hypothetical protein
LKKRTEPERISSNVQTKLGGLRRYDAESESIIDLFCLVEKDICAAIGRSVGKRRPHSENGEEGKAETNV